jgi:tetratricopeptide (TPR) repeat protein
MIGAVMDTPQTSARYTTTRSYRVDLGIILFLVAGTFCLYFQTRDFQFIRFDDPVYVTQNRQVLRGLSTDGFKYAMQAVVSSNWHPLTLLVEMAAVQIFGSSSAVFHTLCATLHGCNVVLLYLFLRVATKVRAPSFAVAILWGWHPMRAESAAWVGELKDVLCGFFSLFTLLCFVFYRRSPSIARYLWVLLCLCLALLAKPMAVTLPAAMMLLNFWPLRPAGQPMDRPWWKRRLLEQIPLVILAAAVGAAAIWTQRNTGATGSLQSFPITLRINNALWCYVCYIGKEFFPVRMGLIYPHPAMLRRNVPVAEWLSGLLLIACTTILCWKARKTRPFLIVGWFWFLGTLIPVIGLIQVGEAAMADRYSYFPSIGITIAIVWLLSDLTVARAWLGRPVLAVFALAVGALAVTAYIQISYWHDDHALLVHSNRVIADDFLAQASLSRDATDAGQIPLALQLARSAVTEAPGVAEAHHALALALKADDQFQPALREFDSAVALDPGNSDLHDDRAQLLFAMHRTPESIQEFILAIKLSPSDPLPRHNLATALFVSGDVDRAIQLWKIVVSLDPNFGPAQQKLADALRIKGDIPGAVQHYRAAIAAGVSDPGVAAWLVWLICNDPGASPQQIVALLPLAKQASARSPAEPFPSFAYSLALARLGQFDAAISAANLALRLAEASHQNSMASDIRSHLAKYRENAPKD